MHKVSKDYDGTEREYLEALRYDPNLAKTHFTLGIQLDDVRKNFDGAEREYHEAIRCDSNHANAHCHLGN
jgi:tetratricopeptide (TPR) repeat protein